MCVKLGCLTHDIEGVLSSAARARLCRLMAKLRNYFSKDANPIVVHLSGACVTAARPCPPRTRHHHCNCLPRFLAKAPLTSSPSTAREDTLSRCKSELFVCSTLLMGCFADVRMHEVRSFSHCQRSIEKIALHCSAHVSVSFPNPIVWISALPQVGGELFCAIVIAIGR